MRGVQVNHRTPFDGAGLAKTNLDGANLQDAEKGPLQRVDGSNVQLGIGLIAILVFTLSNRIGKSCPKDHRINVASCAATEVDAETSLAAIRRVADRDERGRA